MVGYRFIYQYEIGLIYEVYVKNAATVDYRIHVGPLAGRWVTDQQMDLVQLHEDSFKITWHEPTGTSVVLNFMPQARLVHGSAFFPHWIEQDFAKTVTYQNAHLEKMRAYRDEGPTYPMLVTGEFGYITFREHIGADDDSVIACAPGDLPEGFAQQHN